MEDLTKTLFNKCKCACDEYDYHIDESTLLREIERVLTNLSEMS